MSAFIDLTGRKYGRLTVEGVDREKNRIRWICRCECGGTAIAESSNLNTGATQSCGCLRREVARDGLEKNRRPPVHSGARRGAMEPLYNVWCGMKARCHNPNNVSYPRYGGRGVTVCDRWRSSYAAFREDVGERPVGMSLDRINPDGHYEPGNVRWATSAQQARNRADFHCECCSNFQAEPGSTL